MFVVTFMSHLHCFIIVLKIYDDTLMEMVSHANRVFFILLCIASKSRARVCAGGRIRKPPDSLLLTVLMR